MKHAGSIFRAVLCVSTATMMMISWPLWVTGGEFPRVPWIGGLRLLAGWPSWVRFVATIACMFMAAIPKMSLGVETAARWRRVTGRYADRWLAASLALSAWMVLEDQFRLQPWMYQFVLMGLALVACPPGRAWTLCRAFAIALYLYSGLSKLDHVFINDTGWFFVSSFAQAIGAPLKSWGGPVFRVVVVAIPCCEIGLAGVLMFRMRRIGVAGAALLHSMLIITLGPRGMDHSLNVLLWNAAMAVEVAMLFLGRAETLVPDASRRPSRWTSALATGLMGIAVTMPLFERQGYWDTWPSFALYSGSDEKMYLRFKGQVGDLLFAPPKPPWAFRVGQSDTVFVNSWSLRERRVPVYPSSRAFNGVAEALARRYRGVRVASLAYEGKADRRTGKRTRQAFHGLDEIRRHGDTFWINAHPAR